MSKARIEHRSPGLTHAPERRRAVVDQTQCLANLDAVLDACRRFLASDTHDLALVRKTYERIDELLDQRSALTHDQPAI